MSHDLSILCITKAEPHAWPHLQHLAQVAEKVGAQLVVMADGKTAAQAILARGYGRRGNVGVAQSKGYLESLLDDAVALCAGRYVLRMDDDESCTPAMVDWLEAGAYQAEPHWKFPRAHLWGDGTRFVMDAPLWPDHQTRLSLRERSGGRRTIHAGSPFGGGAEAPVLIAHHKFLAKPAAERRAIAERYDRIAGIGHGTGSMLAFSVPEDVYTQVTLCPIGDGGLGSVAAAATTTCYLDPVAEAVERGYAVGMHQHRGEIEPFARWLAARKPHHVIEIGTLHGGTATMFHAIASGTIVSVDLPGGRFGGADHGLDEGRCAARNAAIKAACSRFVGILADSHDTATVAQVRRIIGGEQADLLFIDGDHTYEGVRQDCELFRPLVRPGGVIAFHDVLDTPMHRAAGCRVDRYWQEVVGHKAVFSVDGPWGGIGVTFA